MKTKKVLALLLTIVMLMGLMPQTILAAGPVSIDLSTVNSDGTGYTCSAITVNSKTEYVVTITDSGTYTLTGTIDQPNDPTHPTHVVVSAATADIILNGVSVSLYNFSPLSINSGSTVNLILAEGTTNTLTTASSTISTAGLYVPAGATVIIGGTGTLNAAGCFSGGAGIGGGKGNGIANAGTITINSGIINATGGWEGAGIGGGDAGSCGTITINGGTVKAIGGDHGAGIGNGRNGGDGGSGSIAIKGGTVTATSSSYGDGIGGDGETSSCYPSNITISGGTVVTTSTKGSGIGGVSVAISRGTVTATGKMAGIGGVNVAISGGMVTATGELVGIGYGSIGTNKFTGGSINASSVSPAPSDGTNTVYFTTVTVIDKSGSKLANANISCTMPSGVTFDSVTDSEGKLYLWLPEGNNTTVALTSGGVDYKATGNITSVGPNSLTTAITVPGVTVTPGTVEIEKGNTQKFSAVVEGTNDPAQTVTWSVTGGVAGTSIDNTGVLTVAADETASTLTVTATSTVDSTKSGTATVTVKPTVTGVTVTPGTVEIEKGNTQKFSAVAEGTNDPAQTVTWSVTGGVAGTSMDNAGVLTVAADETASTLTVTATSTVDNTKSGTAAVTVKEPTPTVTGVAVTPATAVVQKGNTQTFSAVVEGTNNPAQTVTWSVTGGVAGTSMDNAGVLTVAADETASTLTVTATSTADSTKSGTATVMVKESVTVIDLSTVNSDGTGYTCSAITVNSKTEYVVTITDSGTYTLTGTIDQPNDPTHPTHVVVSAATADIILNGVSVSLYNFSPLSINSGSTVSLILTDGTTNTLTTASSTISTAGLYVPAGATVIIGGTGTLNAAGCYDGGAGIGGGKGNGIANAGSITINSGIINATGGWEGAGIGGGDKGDGGTITINGGIVNATGGDDGAGIGGGREGAGGSIAISGGTVTATGKAYVGIGRGIGNFSSSAIKFTGGSIKTNYVSTQPSDGTSTVYFTTVTVIDKSGNTLADTNISCTMPSGVTFDSVTDGEGKLYLWLPAGNNTTVALTSGGVDYKATGNIKTAGSNSLTTAITVTGVTVVPVSATVTKGNTQAFSALVAGTNNPQTVTWSVTGGVSGTSIDSTGVLTVAADESASTLTVKATSTADNTKSGIATVTVKEPPATVTGVTVTPATATVQKGNTQTFSAVVAGTNNPAQTVTWSVTGGVSGTSIDGNGILTVAADESASTLTVKATSTVDNTKSGTATVTVADVPPPAPVVDSVTVTPATAMVQKGSIQTFSAAVIGTNNPAQTVTWTVYNNSSSDTSIDSTGLLTIAADETASTLTVTATSAVDSTKFGTAAVTVTDVPPPAPVVDSVRVTPATVEVLKGSIQTFSAAVIGTNNPAQTVTWAVYNNSSSDTSIDNTGLLTVAANEMAIELTVRATSTVDNAKSGTATVTVTNVPPSAPVVTGVIITPAAAIVQKGSIQTFSAAVTGVNNPAQTVTWSVIGGTTGTSIDSNGVLTVAADETADTLTVMATSTVDNTKSGSATITVTAQTYVLTITAGTGGSITSGSSGNYAAGTVINIAATASANYSFNHWSSIGGGTFGSTTSAGTTFTMPANTAAITASFTYNSGSSSSSSKGGGSSSSSSTAVTAPSYNASVSGTGIAAATLPITVNTNTGRASLIVEPQQGNAIAGGGTVVITVPAISGAAAYTLGIPVDYLSMADGKGSLAFKTNTGSVTILSNMLTGVAGAEEKNAEITIGQGDKSGLSEAAKAAVGDRPLIQLAVTIDGKQIEWNNPNAPVTISIPYKPTAAELANPESIIIWYIDGSGNTVCVPNGHYDPTAGTVTFTATHFSCYAVGYNKVNFKDVAANAWYNKAVGFIAARGISTGTGNGNYSPEAKLTRGEFMVMLLKAYGIKPDTNPKDNFADAGSTYYTGYLAAAKRLGITGGTGNNMFEPGKEITRQEMFTLLYKALKVAGKLPAGTSGKQLSSYSDAGQVASWAKDAMTLFAQTGIISGNSGKLSATSTTTRAEMAQVLYNLLSK